MSVNIGGIQPQRRVSTKPAPKDLWVVPGSFGVLTLLLLLARQGTIVEFLYPAMALVVGIFLLARYPAHFLSFSWWLWFLSPEVRRLVDFFHGTFNPTSPIQVAPIAVGLLPFFTILQRARFLGTRAGLPFLLMLVAEVYAYVVGMINNGFLTSTFEATGWFIPVFFALQIAIMPERYPDVRRVLMKTFITGSIVMGAYGIMQYILMPPWDALWLLLSGMTSSMGQPVPFGVRVFSTLNSTGPFSTAMTAGIVLAMVPPYRGRLIAAGLATVGLALTLARSSWGGAFIALMFMLTVLDARTKIRILFAILIISALSIPFLTSGPGSERLQSRFNTVGNLGNDNSFQSRTDFYQTFFTQATENMAGVGMGRVGTGVRLASDSDNSGAGGGGNSVFDSGLMAVPFTLGWPGALLFCIGVGASLWRAAKVMFGVRKDLFVAASFALSLSIFAQMVFANTLIGLPGIIYMTGVMVPLVAASYQRSRRGQVKPAGVIR